MNVLNVYGMPRFLKLCSWSFKSTSSLIRWFKVFWLEARPWWSNESQWLSKCENSRSNNQLCFRCSSTVILPPAKFHASHKPVEQSIAKNIDFNIVSAGVEIIKKQESLPVENIRMKEKCCRKEEEKHSCQSFSDEANLIDISRAYGIASEHRFFFFRDFLSLRTLEPNWFCYYPLALISVFSGLLSEAKSL